MSHDPVTMTQANGEPFTFLMACALSKYLSALRRGFRGSNYNDTCGGSPEATRQWIIERSTPTDRRDAWDSFHAAWLAGACYTKTEQVAAKHAGWTRSGTSAPSTSTATPVPSSAFDEFDEAAPSTTPAIPLNNPKPPRATFTPGSLEAKVQEIAQDVVANALEGFEAPSTSVDPEQVRTIAQEEISKATTLPRVIQVSTNGEPPKAPAEYVHPAFEEALACLAAGLNVMLVGPAGCGKTHLARSIARHLSVPYAEMSYSLGATESWLLGRSVPNLSTGESVYTESAYVANYSRPGVTMHDEMDRADANLLTSLNAGTANGSFYNPINGQTYHRHPQSYQMAGCNTNGTGADSLYVAAQTLDASTLSRWYQIPMDYDRRFEASIGDPEICAFVWSVRERAQRANLTRVVCTRMIQKGTQALRAGRPLREIKTRLLAGWTRDELATVGVA